MLFPLPGKMRRKISQCGMLQLFRTSDRTWSATAARTSRHPHRPRSSGSVGTSPGGITSRISFLFSSAPGFWQFLIKEKNVFSEGDMAVYPAHGVGVIRAVETKKIGGIDQSFYVFEILDNSMRIMIPTSGSKNVGLRAIVGKHEVSNVYDILADRSVVLGTQTWNRRYRDYMEKIKTGSVQEVAVVLRDLFLLSVDKDLSYGERKMLDTAKNLLVKELSLAQNTEESAVSKSIEAIFS
jgi:CarD family transcriptional regulator